jgi:hypothetical protein
MKKIALLLLVTFQALSLQAQQTVKFKIGYKPNTTYKLVTEQKSKTSVSYGADIEPMDQETAMKVINTVKIGKLTGNVMPLVMTMEADKDSDATAVMPQGATVYGIVKQDNSVQFDSINAPGMPEQAKTVIMTMMKSVATQYVVPERTVKVGETFVVDTPVEVPMGPVNMLMNTKTTYKLLKIEGKKAYFDMNMVIDISAKVSGQDMKGSGTGSGSLVYDMDKNFFTQQVTKADSKITFEAQGMKMSISSIQDSTINAEITTN